MNWGAAQVVMQVPWQQHVQRADVGSSDQGPEVQGEQQWFVTGVRDTGGCWQALVLHSQDVNEAALVGQARLSCAALRTGDQQLWPAVPGLAVMAGMRM